MNPSIIEAKFRRSKLDLDKTKLWRTVNIDQQESILNKISLTQDEKELICYYNGDNWWLLTTNNLIVCNKENIKQIKLFEIFKIELSNNIKNINSSELFIDISCNDNIIKLELEKSSWPIIVEILKLITTAEVNVN
ncbi:hypothetical protein [Chryseobacterium shigense]|uniref:YokE-like PH domain-containing protein n=1 Tax=Chryseobacterium shigense TaxID=297244 RepID=A0A841N890_9FLAO|nr:hypothetical protein [Chryseobacterium shigense]MBB6369650.1 hypothetical protein [Chryseobacterium shigense]